ncbi:uncharacterized protein LOC144446224 [Glandiceps talaboti]
MDMKAVEGFFLYVILVQQASIVDAHTNCRKDWTAYDNNCYYYNSNSYSWDAAMEWCRDIVNGGDLASIHSSSENSQVLGMIGTNIHIGFTDLSLEDDWEWSDGRSVVYTNWNSGEPSGNSGLGNCAGMYTSGKWDDYTCTTTRPFVCKVPMEWTSVQTGCQCYFDTTRYDCACCRDGGCNCGISYPNQCVECGSSDCGQDYSDPIDQWKVVFKIVSSLDGLASKDLWSGTNTLNDGDTDAPYISYTSKHYKSSDANTWDTSSIQQIKFAFYDSGVEKMSLVFDASGTSKTSFYSSSYLLYAPYTDIYSSSMNYFSMSGHSTSTLGRHWFISSYYSGCNGDAGWVCVSDPTSSSGGCDWENMETRPNFIYSTSTTRQAWASGNTARADVFAMFFKETVDTSDEDLCDSGWTHYGNGCYQIYEDTKTWFEAVAACRALDDDADLISIHSYDETMHALSMSRWTFANTDYWIGAHDLNEEDEWEWIDGSPFDYTRWYSGEPSNGNGVEDCAALRWSTDGTWNDASCSGSKGYICKYPLDVASCGEWKRKGYTNDGYYTIDPDGPYNGVDPFRVYCDFSSESNAIHVFHHAQEQRGHITDFEAALSYNFEITYDNGVTMDQMKAVMDISDTCYQYLKYECYGSIMKYGGTNYAAWYDRDGNIMNNWAGAPSGQTLCACGNEGTCANGVSTCNCDNNDGTWRYDDGTITDKDYLPVSKLGFGDSSTGEEGYFTLGAFYCKGESTDVLTSRLDFHLIPYKYISNNNNEEISDQTAEECAAECASRTSYTCRSFDYDGKCYLSEYNHIMNGGLTTGTSNNSFCTVVDEGENLFNEQENCDSGWVEYDSHCYYPGTSTKTWLEAETWCQGYGGHLTSTNDENEYNFLRRMLRWTVATTFTFLIGYNDIENEGQWVEADGSDHSYSNWRSSEPNGDELENAVLMYARDDDDWIDANVETSRQFICKAAIGASAIPQPTVDPSCSSSWVSLGDSCYYFSSSAASYANAQSDCKSMDSDLVIIENNEEWTFISHYMRYRYYSRSYWIGLTDTSTEGTWLWANGHENDLSSNWLSGTPDNSGGSENCARFDQYNGYDDKSCADSNYYICEDNHNPTDSPNDIEVSVQSPSAALFSWSDPAQMDSENSDIIGFKLYYWKRNQQSGTTKSVTVNSTSIHTLEMASLTPGTEYEFHMTAYNSYGEGPASDPPLNFTMKEARIRTENYVTSVYRISSGKYLQNHAILTTEAFTLQHCTNICTQIEACQSVNFHVGAATSKKTCVINSGTKESHSNDVTNHNSYTYAGL